MAVLLCPSWIGTIIAAGGFSIQPYSAEALSARSVRSSWTRIQRFS